MKPEIKSRFKEVDSIKELIEETKSSGIVVCPSFYRIDIEMSQFLDILGDFAISVNKTNRFITLKSGAKLRFTSPEKTDHLRGYEIGTPILML